MGMLCRQVGELQKELQAATQRMPAPDTAQAAPSQRYQAPAGLRLPCSLCSMLAVFCVLVMRDTGSGALQGGAVVLIPHGTLHKLDPEIEARTCSGDHSSNAQWRTLYELFPGWLHLHNMHHRGMQCLTGLARCVSETPSCSLVYSANACARVFKRP